MQIPFVDLKTQQSRIRDNVEQALIKVLDHGAYIMGDEVFKMEKDLSKFCGVKNTLSCSSGTDALLLPLMAWGVKAGDAVFVPSFTFTATGEVVSLLGATPIFIDVDVDTLTMDADSLKQGIIDAKVQGLNPKVIIPVDLFGHSADWDSLIPIAKENKMYVLDDAAQGFGGTYKGNKIGTIGDACATSFFPAKPLGCYGDGGAVFTNDNTLNNDMISIRVHGQDNGDKYKNSKVGLNARMDTMQCAILIEKLKIFNDEIDKRNAIANRYENELSGVVKTPVVADGVISTWAQYTLVLQNGSDRDAIQDKLRQQGVPTAVYYPIPMHRQDAYQNGIVAGGKLPVSDMLSKTVLSIPMHPYLTEKHQGIVIQALRDNLK